MLVSEASNNASLVKNPFGSFFFRCSDHQPSIAMVLTGHVVALTRSLCSQPGHLNSHSRLIGYRISSTPPFLDQPPGKMHPLPHPSLPIRYMSPVQNCKPSLPGSLCHLSRWLVKVLMQVRGGGGSKVASRPTQCLNKGEKLPFTMAREGQLPAGPFHASSKQNHTAKSKF